MSVLQNILKTKRAEVSERRSAQPERVLEQLLKEVPAPRDFVGAITNCSGPAVIAEIKRSSPSRGPIRPDLDPIAAAEAFRRAGAAALSVLTDARFFGGSLDLLARIRASVPDIPLLRKDFLIDPYQVIESRCAAADAILLIVAALSDAELLAMLNLAAELKLQVLVEAHDEKELERAIKVLEQRGESRSAVLLGINNRDLNTFITDLSVFERLAAIAKRSSAAQIPLVAESGLFNAGDLMRMKRSGATAYLIGESLVAVGDPGENLTSLLAETVKLSAL